MINNIQVLRCFAALLVVMYHIPGIMSKYGLGNLELGKWSAFGVDIFFVISGYIMAKISSKHSHGPLDFLKKRIGRIVPLYVFLTLVFITLQFLVPSAFNSKIYDFKQNTTSLFLISHFFGYDYPSLYVGWSLELEALFYILFSVSMLVKAENSKYFLLMLMVLFSIKMNLSPSISIEFLYGILIYKIDLSFKVKKKPSYHFFYITFILLCFMASGLHCEISPTTFTRPFTYGAIAFFIVLFAVIFSDAPKNILTKIGDASYSIYLTQVFSLPVILKFFLAIGVKNSPQIVFFSSLLFSIVIGYMTYYLIELRIKNALNSIFGFLISVVRR